MYVKTYESDSLDKALKDIKQDLGPEAIILKTKTNKGLKGVMSKSKIEITAGITEKDYTKKLKVDNVLEDKNMKEEFYNYSSKYISKKYNEFDDAKSSEGGYGKIGLNKSIKKKNENENDTPAKNNTNEIKSNINLDNFLSGKPKEILINNNENLIDNDQNNIELMENNTPIERNIKASLDQSYLDDSIKQHEKKLEDLETKIFELMNENKLNQLNNQKSVVFARKFMTSIGLCEKYIQGFIKNILMDLKEEHTDNLDYMYEEIIKDINSNIKISDNKNPSNINILISENSCGQQSMAHKIAKENGSQLIVLSEDRTNQNKKEFTESMINKNVIHLTTIQELMIELRKFEKSNQSIIVDCKISSKDTNKTTLFIEGLKRSYKNVEVSLCLSSINSENYNLYITNKYNKLIDNLIFTFLDSCLDWGAIFNVSYIHNRPISYFGTGEYIPKDIEIATKERLISNLFQL
jgi:flagellar biosynthesis protein FlhF